MAPVEFEKDLQNKMRSRVVEPKADSWDRIEARLDAEAPRSKKTFLKWKLLAAASVVFFLGFFLMRESDLEVPKGAGVVENPGGTLPEAQDISDKTTDFTIPESDSPTSDIAAGQRDENPVSPKASKVPMQVKKERQPLRQAVLADRSLDIPPPELRDEMRISTADLATAAESENSNDKIADSEVDALLSRALEVVEKRGAASDTTALNPARLLNEVESELDETFREQILKKLKTGYNKVRTAVADRSK